MKWNKIILLITLVFWLMSCTKPEEKGIIIYDASYGQDRQDAVKGQTVTFYNTSSPSLTRFVWDFGDDSPQVTGNRVKHKFYKKGTFYITMNAFSSDGSITREYHNSVIIGDKYVVSTRLDRMNFKDNTDQYWDVNNYYPVAKIVMVNNQDTSIKFDFGNTPRLTLGKFPYTIYPPNINYTLDTTSYSVYLYALDQDSKDKLVTKWDLNIKSVYNNPITLDKGDGNVVKIFYNLK